MAARSSGGSAKWFKVVTRGQWPSRSHPAPGSSPEPSVAPQDPAVSPSCQGSAPRTPAGGFCGGASCAAPSPGPPRHCRCSLRPWWTLQRIFVPTWWRKPTFDKTWFMPAPRRFPSHVPLLKMFCWRSLESISLTKLGRFVMLIDLGSAVSEKCSRGSCGERYCWLYPVCCVVGMSDRHWLHVTRAGQDCIGLFISKIRQPQIGLCYWRAHSFLLFLSV